jgi:hypothetical protein
MVKSHIIHSAWDDIFELYDVHCIEFHAECLELVDYFLADYNYRRSVAEGMDGGVRGPNRTRRVSKAANERPTSSFLSAGRN